MKMAIGDLFLKKEFFFSNDDSLNGGISSLRQG